MKKLNKHNVSETGFKTPDDYFASFEENLLSEINLKEKVNATGFKTPDGYFDNFKVTISENGKQKSEPKVISLFRNKKWLAAASIAAVFIVLISFPKETDNSLDFASLDSDSIETYLLNNDFDSAELNNLIVNTTDFESSILEETLNDVHLEDYLYNNMELEDLNLE